MDDFPRAEAMGVGLSAGRFGARMYPVDSRMLLEQKSPVAQVVANVFFFFFRGSPKTVLVLLGSLQNHETRYLEKKTHPNKDMHRVIDTPSRSSFCRVPGPGLLGAVIGGLLVGLPTNFRATTESFHTLSEGSKPW